MNQTPPRHQSAAPQPALVLRALYQLEPEDVVRAALHLATPRSVAVGVHVRVEGGRATWRGEQATFPSGASWDQVAALAVDLAQRGWARDDNPVTLDGDPASWLKLVRSGAHIHLAGSRELFAGQLITFDPGVCGAAARVVATKVRDRESLTAGTLYVGGQVLAVRATAGAAHVEL